MKKLKILFSVLCLAAMVFGSQAFADSHFFEFMFTDLNNQRWPYYPETYVKTDSEQSWYISLDTVNTSNNIANTMSSSNIFGCKMHDNNGAVVDTYHTFKNYVSSYPVSYIATVSQYEKMYLGGKKDSDSTSSAALRISGRFAP